MSSRRSRGSSPERPHGDAGAGRAAAAELRGGGGRLSPLAGLEARSAGQSSLLGNGSRLAWRGPDRKVRMAAAGADHGPA
jgi:hypothetical protein